MNGSKHKSYQAQAITSSKMVYIADRRDLLGGRLIPLLNAIRLSSKSDEPYYFTWHEDASDFQANVKGIDTLFQQEFISAHKIEINDPLIACCDNAVMPIETSTNDYECMGNIWVQSVVKKNVLLDRNYQLYSCGPNDSFLQAKRELGSLFFSLPFCDSITCAINQIRDKMHMQQFSAIHIRRMHLNANTTMSVNRFYTHIGDRAIETLITKCLDEGKKVYLASDSFALAKRIKNNFSSHNIFTQDDIIDLRIYNNVQQALLGIISLASANQIFGSRSAYSIIASIIGNIPWINSHAILAYEKEFDGDQTGAVNLIASREFARESFEPAYLLMKSKITGSFAQTLNALVARCASQRGVSFSTDWQHYTHELQQTAANLLPDIIPRSIVSMINEALAAKTPLPLLDSFACAYPALYALEHILLGDSGVHPIENYEKAIKLCASIGVSARGIWLRLCDFHLSNCNLELADSCANCALLLDAEYADTYYILGYIAGLRGDSNAIYYSSMSCQLEPDNAEYFYQLSCFYSKARLNSEAQECAQIAASIEPATAKYLNHLDTLGSG